MSLFSSFSVDFPHLPQNFCEHYVSLLGEKEGKIFLQSCSTPLRKCVRVNTLKISTEKFLEEKEKQWNTKSIAWCADGFFFDRPENERTPMGNQLLHRLGGVYMQEASSMLPVEALFFGHETENFSGKIVVDVSAAPGSKTTQMAAKTKGNGVILANELSASRTKALFSNLERCGVANSILTNMDGEKLCALLGEQADFILLDAPCTGEGTVRKNFDALKNWSLQNAKKLSGLQKKLLFSAFFALKEGGELVYSTCTLSEEENQLVVNALMEEFSEYVEIVPLGNLFEGAKKAETKEGYLLLYPHFFDTEGFFVAKIRKIKSTQHLQTPLPKIASLNPKKRPFQPCPKKKIVFLQEYFEKKWGFALPKKGSFWEKNGEIWWFPENAENVFAVLHCDRVGLPLAEMHNEDFRLTHECSVAWGKNFSQNTVEVEEGICAKIFEGQNVELEKSFSNGEEVVLLWKNFVVATGKIVNGVWKNGLPRANIRR